MTRTARATLPTGTLTFLFTDVEGSTRLLQSVGHEVFRTLMQAHQSIVRAALAEHDGIEVSTEGDSFFAVFEEPLSAVRAAATIQSTLAAHPWPQGAGVRIRIGLHTGEAHLGGDSYLGIDVNLAARIAAAAYGGMTLVSSAARALVSDALPDGLWFRDLGLHRLKDIDDAERLAQLVVDGLPADFPPPRTLETPLELPALMTSFVGRHLELDAGVQLLSEARLVTLTGPGGTGKTRLSIEIAREAAPSFADGAWFVDLSTISDPALVPAAIATALRIPEAPQRATGDRLIDHLRDRSLVLVLDNFEQVLPAREIVGRILTEAGGVRVLVSSREPLRLPGEREYPVPPLGLPDRADGDGREQVAEAVDLFADRARAVRPDFAVTPANAGDIAAIVRRLDGLPLAIELAAARTRVLAPAELLGRLERSLDVVATDAPLPDRQRTLEGAIAWSHDLLDERERRLFARLAVFVGGATLDAIESICADEGLPAAAILDLVAALVERSLVRRVEVGGASRYSMLDTIRSFARERLVASEEFAVVEERHTAYFVDMARAAEPHMSTSRAPEWLDRLEADHDNLRAVLRRSLERGPLEPGLLLAGAIWRFWQQRSHLREGRRWLTELLAAPGAEERTAARADALAAEAGLLYWQGDMTTSRQHYEEVLAIREELGDASGVAWTLHDLGFTQMEDPRTGRETLRQAVERFRELGDRAGIASASGAIGYASMMLHDATTAESSVREALALNQELGQYMRAIDNYSGLGQLARTLGRLDEAEEYYREGLRLIRRTGDATRPAMLLEELAAVAFDKGETERAARLLGAVAGVRERLGGTLSRSLMLTGDLERLVRDALGTDTFESATAAGRGLDVEGAIADALGEAGEPAP